MNPKRRVEKVTRKSIESSLEKLWVRIDYL